MVFIVVKLTERDITEALKHNGYEANMASARAPLVARFFEATDLEQRLQAAVCHEPRQLEFLTGDTSCTIENADMLTFGVALPPKTDWLGGTWMDTAPLTYLARVCDIGSRLLGENWTEKFKKRLTNREGLLDVLNEVWWLGCWKNITSIQASPKADTSGDNDWLITLGTVLPINLQVKRRRNDLLRLTHPTRPPYGLFDKLSKRFSRTDGPQINVGAITIYAGITDSVLRAVDDYFKSDLSTNVDAIILWSPDSPPGLPPSFIRDRKSRGQLSKAFDLDPMDRIYKTCNIFPLSINEAVAAPTL